MASLLRRRVLRSARGGFTLLELMFALAIGLVVVAGLYNLFMVQVRQFIYQDLQMEMHQSSRLAVDLVGRSARMAGFGTNGTSVGVLGGGGSDDNVLPAIISYNGTGPNGSDAVTFVSMDPSLVVNTSATAPPSCSTTTLEVDPTVLNNGARLAQYAAGDLLLCLDYATVGRYRSFLWPMTNAATDEGELTVENGALYSDFAADCSPTDNLPLVMPCSRAEVVTFYIDADDSDGIGAGSAENPVLMMDLDFESPDADDVPLVDNVEDLQIAYCLQSNTGATDCSDPTAWVNAITVGQVSDVYMMRVSVVVRSSRTDPARLHVGQRPALEDNAAGADDAYFRRVLSTEVVVRNMRLQSVL